MTTTKVPKEPSPIALAVVTVPWSKLHPNPWNPNKMDTRTYDAAVESIQTFGFVDPLTVRPHPDLDGEYQIIDGFHRWKATGDLKGHDVTVDVISLPIDEPAAKKLTIILNETRGEADPVLLGTLLKDLTDSFSEEELRKGLRYDDAELAHLLSLADVDWNAFEKKEPEADPPAADTEWQTITARIPKDVWPVWQEALDRIKDETNLHADPSVEAGQAIEILAAAYLAQ